MLKFTMTTKSINWIRGNPHGLSELAWQRVISQKGTHP